MVAREASTGGLGDLAWLVVPPNLKTMDAGERRALATRVVADALGSLTGGNA